jgi:peroxiredoxin Q/BCP
MSQIAEGTAAPDFTLPADGGGTVTLSQLKGKIVVLYFYPKDDTSGCTTEAIDFTRLLPEFEALGAVVIGISPDSANKHDKFKAKHDLAVTWSPTRSGRRSKPMASGSRKACMAENIWAWSAPLS